MRSCPSYLFHGLNDGAGWQAQEKYEDFYSSGLPEEYARQQSVRKHERTAAKEETARHHPKNVAIDNVQWLAIRFRSDQRIGCKTVPNAAIAQMNSSIARTTIKKNPAFMSCITGIIPPPSSCSTRPLRQTEPKPISVDVSAY